MIDDQDPMSFGRFVRSKNSKLPLFSCGSSKLVSVCVNFIPSYQSLGRLSIVLASLSGRYSGWVSRGLIQKHMFIFRTVASYPRKLESLFPTLIMSTYNSISSPSLHFKDSCSRPWNYCSPTPSSSYLGASWSGSYPLILLITIAYRSCSAPSHLSP